MQIYTRTGDKGKTKLIGGSSVYKDDPRVEAYGTIDELNSVIGICAFFSQDWPELQAELIQIQQYVFDCGNDIANPNPDHTYRLSQDQVDWLESRLDIYSKQAPEIQSFILPGGSQLASHLHLARTVTRRAERRTITFAKDQATNQYAIKFINRLSDYFFAVARVANAKAGVEDILYVNSGKVFHKITKDQLPD